MPSTTRTHPLPIICSLPYWVHRGVVVKLAETWSNNYQTAYSFGIKPSLGRSIPVDVPRCTLQKVEQVFLAGSDHLQGHSRSVGLPHHLKGDLDHIGIRRVFNASTALMERLPYWVNQKLIGADPAVGQNLIWLPFFPSRSQKRSLLWPQILRTRRRWWCSQHRRSWPSLRCLIPAITGPSLYRVPEAAAWSTFG